MAFRESRIQRLEEIVVARAIRVPLEDVRILNATFSPGARYGASPPSVVCRPGPSALYRHRDQAYSFRMAVETTRPDGLHPLWVRTGKAGAVPEDWRILPPLLDTMARLFSVEIVILDADGLCVAGTGPYADAPGIRAPEDTSLAHSLRSGENVLMLNPGDAPSCDGCSMREDCLDQANYSGPVRVDGEVVAAVQIVAFDKDQRGAVLQWAESTFNLVAQLVEQLYRAGVLRPGRRELPVDDPPALRSLIGKSSVMSRLRERIRKASAMDAPVLITGESGTGKELAAQALHALSPRAAGPFVPVNCGALPEALMESELFGYAQGAFSGADRQGSRGLWEAAGGGTLFLDEVAELSPAMQVKLLRALEDGVIRRVGGRDFTPVDTRVVAATNRDLSELVASGAFRLDLYHRINVIPLHLPPLRERREDIRLLVNHFIEQFCARGPNRVVRADPSLLPLLEAHSWPGNVRELRNAIEYGIHFADGATITWEVLAERFRSDAPPKRGGGRRTVSREEAEHAVAVHGSTLEGKRAAARSLGISLATLYRALKDET